jgi:hypothetical protein
MEWNYDFIKDEAKRLGVPITDLIALAPSNDPMYAGKPADKTIAQWFARLWRRFGYGSGVHLRRVHYQIISQDPPVKLPDGMKIKIGEGEYTDVYLNYDACWNFLTQASKQARYLGLVDAGAFDDRRNPEAIVNASMYDYEPRISTQDQLWQSPRLPDFPELPHLDLYDYEQRQRYMIELWCEKSTVNDVLRPLCEQYGANLQTGLGELSITATLNAVNRIVEGGRPTRIFYISDFDPAGQSMPVAVSRKIEYFVRNGGDSLDIRLIPIVLTAEQIREYNLPRTPIKDTERRANSFEQRHGEGAVELDALEALHPGALARILRGYMDEYFDHSLRDRVRQAAREVITDMRQVEREVVDPHRDAIDALRREYADIRADFEARIAKYSTRQTELWQAIAQEMDQRKPRIWNYPMPEADESSADWELDPLYDSERDYVTQIGAYKQFQGKPVGAIDN